MQVAAETGTMDIFLSVDMFLTSLFSHAGFVVEALVYVSKVGNQDAIRRATPGRVEASTSLIHAHLSQTNSSDAFGPASRRYWAIHHARQPEGTPVAPPESTTFAQLQLIDSQQREIDDAAVARVAEPEFIPVRCRLNGDIIKLYLSVEDLRSGLGLPAYSLRPPYRAPLPTTDNVVNVDDTDHMEDEFTQETTKQINHAT